MARLVLQTELVTRSTKRANVVGHSLYEADELTTLVFESVAALYDKLIEVRGHAYYKRTAQLSTVDGERFVELPEDFYQLCSPPRCYASGQWRTLDPVEEHEIARLLNVTASTGTTFFYSLRGHGSDGPGVSSGASGAVWDVIEILPVPRSVFLIEVDYVPTVQYQTIPPGEGYPDGAVAYNGINGYEEWAVLDAAIKMKAKEGTDASDLVREKAAQEARIARLASFRDASRPKTVRRVRRYR
jgi:hypothetical protein